MSQSLSKSWRWLLALLLIVGLLAITANLHNWPVTLTAIILASILLVPSQRIAGKINQIPRKTFSYLIIIIVLVMLMSQCMVLTQLPIAVYHDPFRLLHQSLQLAHGHFSWHSSTYFWRYPNNAVPAILLSHWFVLTNLLGISANFSLMVLQLLMLDGFIILAIVTGWQLSHRQSIVLVITAFCALTPFAYTYFLNVTYTDLPNMLILLVVLRTIFLWQGYSGRRRTINFIMLIILSTLAMMIKGNFIVIVPAIILTICTCQLWQKARRQAILPLIAILIGILLSLPAGKVMQQEAHFRPNSSYQFPTIAWVAMGLNQSTSGTYSGHDVNQLIAQPNKGARQRSAKRVIARRLKKAGFLGTAKLFMAKDGIMMNVTDISQWYSGGHRQAPAWWLKYGLFIETALSLLYQTAWATLILDVFWRLIHWSPSSDANDLAIIFAVTTALGYLSFHIFLWEVEGRYGQVMVPILFVLLASQPRSRHQQLNWSYPLIMMAASLICAGMVTHYHKPLKAVRNVNTNANVVASQRSQLSRQYQTRPLQLAPGETITQQVRLNGPAQQFFILVADHSQLKVQLFNLQTGQHYRLTQQQQDFLVLNHPLSAGTYQIVIKNQSKNQQPLAIIHTDGYRLAKQALIRNGFPENNSSLIYTIWRSPK